MIKWIKNVFIKWKRDMKCVYYRAYKRGLIIKGKTTHYCTGLWRYYLSKKDNSLCSKIDDICEDCPFRVEVKE